MSRLRSISALWVLACALGLGLLAPTPTLASFTLPTLVSGSPLPPDPVQADYAYSPAISADGRYVAFTGSVSSIRGVYRKDLQTGELELVAIGNAGAPSISAEGRYVGFTTSENPTTGAAECSEVWVRNMDPQPIAPDPEPGVSEYEPEYELASTLDSSSYTEKTQKSQQPLTYAGSGKAGCPGGGAAAADRVALSADGRKVVFTAIGESNLAGSKTPPDQVAVRDLATGETTLVSATLQSQLSGQPAPVPGGAAVAGSETRNKVPTGIEEEEDHNPISASTAAISADGSTVAWMAVNIPAQAPVAPGYAQFNPTKPESYAEPLWRKIDGAPSPTRRVTGGDDPQSPTGLGPLDLQWSLGTSGAEENGPEYGTFIRRLGFGESRRYHSELDDVTPQLSADGETVAMLCTAPAYGSEPTYPPGSGAPSEVPANAFVVNMATGLTRSQALTPLTEWASTNFGHSNTALSGTLEDIALSPDGTRVAFVTQRSVFPLAPPALITPQVTETSYSQLYEVDLRAGTLALVSQGYEGNQANGNIYSPAFSGDGNTLVFASGASNLVYGAANAGDSDVFATSVLATPALPGQQLIQPLPVDPPPAPQWRISATARRGPAGSLLLDVAVPGEGTLAASASARVPRERTVASTHSSTTAAGVVELHLLPVERYRPLVQSRGGLFATISISFLSQGHSRLREMLQATFRVASEKKKKSEKRRSRGGHR